MKQSLVFVVLFAALATIGCDRVTKHVAASALSGTPGHSLLGDTVRLQYAENTGGFLGLGAEWPRAARTAFFTIGNATLLLGVVIVALRSRWRGAALIGVTLFVAGGASNLLDRIAFGRVIDFLNVGLGPLRTGIFNVADVAILLGAALVALGEVRTSNQEPPEPSEPPEPNHQL